MYESDYLKSTIDVENTITSFLHLIKNKKYIKNMYFKTSLEANNIVIEKLNVIESTANIFQLNVRMQKCLDL
jgi:hypothetical protein